MPTEAQLLAGVLKVISLHETLNPPSPGRWSILRSKNDYPAEIISPFKDLDSESALSPSGTVRQEIIAALISFLAVWDNHCWPPGDTFTHELFMRNPIGFRMLDFIRWRLVQLMRYSVPSRLSETSDECEKLLVCARLVQQASVQMRLEAMQPLEKKEPQLFLYAGVSNAMQGNHALAAKYLRAGLTYLGDMGDLNMLWGLGSLERALAAQGKADEASETWAQITEAAFSAFEVKRGFTDAAARPKVRTHCLALNVEWVPEGRTPLDRFKVINAGLVTDAEAERHSPGTPQAMTAAIREMEHKDQRSLTGPKVCQYGRVLVRGKGTGVNAGLKGSGVTLVSGFTAKMGAQNPHHLNWLATLKAKRTKWGYAHE
ncbi:hypothetical protein RQP46_001385 [Phenoliferia psychrophenolica]